MNINITNYESWFLDYHEGTLSPEEVEVLLAFIREHPELQEEFDAFEMIRVEADNGISMQDKDQLRKPVVIDENNINEWLITELEGHLNEEELMLLHDYLHQHPEKKNDRRVFAATVLESGTEMHPSGKLLYALEPIGEHNIDLWLIAETEGQLHLQQKTALKNFLNNHPAYQRHRELYAMTRLDAMDGEHFGLKSTLYKKDANVVPLPHGTNTTASYRSLFRIAAILMLLIGGWYVFRLYVQPQESQTQLVQQTPGGADHSGQMEQDHTEWSSVEDSVTNGTGVPNDSISSSPSAQPERKQTIPGRKSDRRRKPLRYLAPKVPQMMPQQLAKLTPKGYPVIEPTAPFVFAERRYTPKATPHYNDETASPSLRPVIAGDPLANALLTPRALQEEMGMEEEVIMAERAPQRLPVASRLIKAGAKVVGKITGEKVKVRTAFNPITGKLSAYEVETKNRTWQKQLKSDYVSAE